MRRNRKSSTSRLAAESHRLVLFAQALMQAGSRLEERNWERNLDALVLRLLRNDHQDAIETALDQLFENQSEAYDALMEALEAASESCQIEHDGVKYDALLIAVPLLAWTRFTIPTCVVPAEMLTSFSSRLQAHILSPDARATLYAAFLSIDQMPKTAVETHALTQKMTHSALSGTTTKMPVNLSETPPFLADTRFMLGVVYTPAGQSLFAWQDVQPLLDVAAHQAEALIRWRAEMSTDLANLFPGCNIELQLPNAFAHALRIAEKGIRPASIFAADYFLTQTLNIPSTELQANIAAFAEENVDGQVNEYRIGFSIGQGTDVVYGVVWPLFGPETGGDMLEPEAYEKLLPAVKPTLASSERRTPLEEVLGLLRHVGVTRIKHHEELYAMEFCDDCGAPLYPAPSGELVHAELPEDAPNTSGHFH